MSLLDQDFFDTLLSYVKAVLRLNSLPHEFSVKRAVSLHPCCPDSGSLAPVKDFKLYPRLIRNLCHLPSEGVYFLYKMALGKPPDSRVAGHLADGVNIHSEHGGTETHSRCCQRCFAARMAGADNYNVVIIVNVHGL